MTERKKRYYFAYGSNMDLAQMAQRCPGTTLVGTGKVTGCRFIINSRGVATVVPKPSNEVYGVLRNLTESDEKILDGYEGVKRGTYEKMEMNVGMIPEGSFSALVYVAKDKTPGSPRDGYMGKIVAAAEFHKSLPSSYLV